MEQVVQLMNFQLRQLAKRIRASQYVALDPARDHFLGAVKKLVSVSA
jgi:hypothetical protein